MDDVILETRKLGLSIEGYFQPFGKFSTQDGVRRLDCKQFSSAIANLDGLQWAIQRPHAVEQLFDEFMIAIENFKDQ